MSEFTMSPPSEPTTADGLGAENVIYAGYAGFWKRFAAAFIDGLLLGTCNWLFSMGVTAIFGMLVSNPSVRSGLILAGFIFVVEVAGGWLYSALMESSAAGATLGKQALSLRVTDTDGNRISFGQASGRYFGKFLSAFVLMIGFIMAAFTEKRQALHDLLAGTLVIDMLGGPASAAHDTPTLTR